MPLAADMLKKLQGIQDRSLESLRQNPYPGRGIVAGSTSDRRLFLAYWIMGRSANSRNRLFVAEDAHVRTEAVDPAKLEDPSLIIYYPLRAEGSLQILTNGDQSDTLWNAYKKRLDSAGLKQEERARSAELEALQKESFLQGLSTRTYEPDPHQTPRISCMADAASPRLSYSLSILKASEQIEGQSQRNFFHYEQALAGFGHCIHTYADDGDPIPSFSGEPLVVPVQDDIDEALDFWWQLLNPENRISLMVRLVSPDGSYEQRIMNRFA